MSSSVAGARAEFVARAAPFVTVTAVPPSFRVAIAPDSAIVGLVEAAPTPGATIAPIVARRAAFVVVSPVRATIEQE